jgi:hypothetical protein
MNLQTPILAVAWLLMASAMSSWAEEPESSPDSVLTAEQWRERVQEARHRSEEFVANARSHAADPPSSDKEDAIAADQRAMNDPSLQQGDIIATSRGFVVFVGRYEEHQPNDFLPAPDQR